MSTPSYTLIKEVKMSGKGSKPRPLSVPKEKFDQNWDAIFAKKDQNKPLDKQEENK